MFKALLSHRDSLHSLYLMSDHFVDRPVLQQFLHGLSDLNLASVILILGSVPKDFTTIKVESYIGKNLKERRIRFRYVGDKGERLHLKHYHCR